MRLRNSNSARLGPLSERATAVNWPNMEPEDELHVFPPSGVSRKMVVPGKPELDRAAGSCHSGCSEKSRGLFHPVMMPWLRKKTISVYTVVNTAPGTCFASSTCVQVLPASWVSITCLL